MNKFISWLEKKGRRRDIPDRVSKALYLIRYHLLFDRDKKIARWFNVYLHHFVLSDMDFYHCHPWFWISIVLKGGYWEYRLGYPPKWRGKWSIVFRRPTDFHYIILEPGVDTWTLFIHFKDKREWGFVNEYGKWQDNDSFIKARLPPNVSR